MKLLEIKSYLFIGVALVALSACNTSSSGLDGKEVAKDSKKTSETAKVEGEETQAADDKPKEAEFAAVINDPGKVKNRGGYIKILVNKNPITNFDIQRRAKFLELRRAPGNKRKLAEKELIEQILKLQEAKRRRTLANDEMVDRAYATFAKRNRGTASQLTRQLNQLGVGAPHFKEFIRTQISWQNTVQGRFQAETIRKSERDAVTQLRKSGSAKPEVTEYTFQQIVFVIPESRKTKRLVQARKQEANAFRQRYTSCDETLELAKQLKDVAVLDRRRIMEPELPNRWKDEIFNADAKGTTRVQETEKGIELIAVCNKRQVTDDRAAQIASQSSDFTDFNDKAGELEKSYLDELRSRAKIIYR